MTETIKRLIAGVILAIVYIFVITIDNYYFIYKVFLFIFIFTATLIGIKEVHKCCETSLKIKLNYIQDILIATVTLGWVYIYSLKQYQKNFNITYNEVIQSILDNCSTSFESLLIIFYIFILFGFAARNVFRNPLPNVFIPFSISCFILLYFVIPMSHIFLISAIPNGLFYIWMICWSIIMVDTAAYFCGKLLGKHKIGFALSPNKTYEGYIGGFIGQVILTYMIYFILSYFMSVPKMSMLQIFMFCVVMYIVAIWGDLAGSLIKRNIGVKDFGTSIAGHGGIIDLLDALMLGVPAFYYLRFLFITN